ncbi:hypothetical protein [Riemerella anatipestifer]|uniref:hypothetical protein n=1 Tax=Riemerella anatipestifer TaxID=34085 RepID=UPI0016281768|nr:hypothetical protein [Riemerella anatipestifer]
MDFGTDLKAEKLNCQIVDLNAENVKNVRTENYAEKTKNSTAGNKVLSQAGDICILEKFVYL